LSLQLVVVVGEEKELYPHEYEGMQYKGIMDNVYYVAHHPYCLCHAAVVVKVHQVVIIIIVVVVLVERMI
jgi:hypothetical protein